MRKHDGRIGIALLLCLLLALQMCLTPVAVLAEDGEYEIEYSATGFSGPYDGKPHSISVSVSTQGVSVRYAYPAGSAYSATNPTFTNPGSYTVGFMIDGPGYSAVEDSATVTITEGNISYSASDYRDTYDGKPHSISVNVTSPADATVRYAYPASGAYSSDNPAFTDAGNYKVAYIIEKQYYETQTGIATVAIEKADVSDAVEATLPGSFPYTGSPVSFSPSCDGITSWEYSYSNSDGPLSSAPSAPGSYTVKIIGSGPNHYATIFHPFTILQEEIPEKEIEYSIGNYTGTYDGKPHSILLDVYTPGVKATYSYTANGSFTTSKPRFVNAGKYTVYYRLEKEGFETAEGSATVTINRVDVSGLVKFNQQGSYAYTGSPVDFAPGCEGISSWTYYHYDGNGKRLSQAPSAPGSYSVTMSGSGTNHFARISHTYRIVEAQEIEYTASGYTGAHDGAAHTIDLRVTTEGVSATFATSEGGAYSADMPSFTDVGTYTVWFRLEKEGYETVVGSANVTIIGKIEYSVDGYHGYYDGEAHYISVSVATEGVTATFATSEDGAYTEANPSFIEPGEHTVWFRLEKEGYETITGVAKVIIAKLSKIEYSVEDYSGYYDGEEHTIALNVITEGVTVSYATYDGVYGETPIRYTDVGFYIVWFQLEKEGYETVIDFAEVTIAKPGTILYTVESYIGTYDGKPHSISLNVLTEGVTVTYFLSGVGSKTPPTFTEPGNYTVYFLLEKEGYVTKRDFRSVKIHPGVIEYRARGYSGYADGKAHSISLYVSTPDAKVSYATSEDGEYSAAKPSFSKVGTHTVWYRIEKEHYETVEGSEVVKLLQQKEDSIVYSVEDYVGAYDGEAHTIALDVTTPDVKASYATSEKGAYGATLPTFTEPGTYTVWFKLEKSGYETSTGSATVTIEKAEQILYFKQTVRSVDPSENSTTTFLYWSGLIHEKGDGALSWSCSDPSRIHLTRGDIRTGTLRFDVPYEEWSKGYSATITATAAETDHYKAATATCTVMASSSVKGDYAFDTGNNSAENTGNSQNQEMLVRTDLDLTVRPVTHLDNERLSGVSNELRKKLMASAGSDQIGAMAVDAVLTDNQTGEELHSTTGDLTLTLTGDLLQSYQQNYKNMAFVAVHIKQDVRYNPDNTSASTGDPTIERYDFTMPTDGVTVNTSFAPTDSPTAAPTAAATDGAGVYVDSSGFTMDGGTIDTSGANTDGAGVSADSSGFTMTGGTIDTATTGNGNSSLIGNTGNGIGGGNSGEGSNIQISGGSVSATGNTGNGIGGGSSGEGSNIQISGGSVKGNAGPNGTQVYKTEVDFDGNNSSGANPNGSTNHIPGSLSLDDPDNSNEEQLLVSTHGDLTLVPTGSLSPTVEFIPCELTESGVIIKDTSLSPFLLIYGPKEAFSKLLTVRAKDGVFTYDGEGHAVAAEPSIAEGTSLYYSLDLENWQTEAPSFTDVLWNGDGSIGSWQVYVLADNPDCDPAVCSYTVTIPPAA